MHRPARWALHAALIVFSIWSLFPVAWVAVASLRPNLGALAGDNPFVFTPEFTNYQVVWGRPEFLRYFGNTLKVSLTATALSLFFGLLAGYGLARFRFRGGRALSRWILSIRLAPPMAFVIPFFIMFKSLGLLDTPAALITVYSAFLLPFSIWLFSSFIRDVPAAAEEAAMADGCTRLGALFRVVLPRLWPAIGAVTLLNLVAAWNEFLFSLTLTSARAATLPVAVASFVGERGVLWGQITAAAISTMTVPILLSLIINRYLLRGMTMSAVK